MKKLFCLFLILWAARAAAADSPGALTVKMAGFRNDDGVAQVLLFRGKDGFPKDYKKTYQIITSSITNGASKAEFTGLPPGSYAVSVLHDDNWTGKMETNWLGIPKKGVGTSNNASTIIGPPSYKASSFDVNTGTKTITIKIKYYLGK